MRIGLVCEGPSDIPAVKHFIGDQLRRRGIQPEFYNLFPEPDRTRDGAGWSNLLLWLKKYPVEVRIARYFSGGLFGGGAASQPLDAIIVQIDADVVKDASFRTYVADNFALHLAPVETATQRGKAVENVLIAACNIEEMTQADRKRHVLATAVESTETWCLASFEAKPDQFEEFREQRLIDAFMKALEISESRPPQDHYANCDKNSRRRDKFCHTFAPYSERIINTCPHFSKTVQSLFELL